MSARLRGSISRGLPRIGCGGRGLVDIAGIAIAGGVVIVAADGPLGERVILEIVDLGGRFLLAIVFNPSTMGNGLSATRTRGGHRVVGSHAAERKRDEGVVGCRVCRAGCRRLRWKRVDVVMRVRGGWVQHDVFISFSLRPRGSKSQELRKRNRPAVRNGWQEVCVRKEKKKLGWRARLECPLNSEEAYY